MSIPVLDIIAESYALISARCWNAICSSRFIGFAGHPGGRVQARQPDPMLWSAPAVDSGRLSATVGTRHDDHGRISFSSGRLPVTMAHVRFAAWTRRRPSAESSAMWFSSNSVYAVNPGGIMLWSKSSATNAT